MIWWSKYPSTTIAGPRTVSPSMARLRSYMAREATMMLYDPEGWGELEKVKRDDLQGGLLSCSNGKVSEGRWEVRTQQEKAKKRQQKHVKQVTSSFTLLPISRLPPTTFLVGQAKKDSLKMRVRNTKKISRGYKQAIIPALDGHSRSACTLQNDADASKCIHCYRKIMKYDSPSFLSFKLLSTIHNMAKLSSTAIPDMTINKTPVT